MLKTCLTSSSTSSKIKLEMKSCEALRDFFSLKIKVPIQNEKSFNIFIQYKHPQNNLDFAFKCCHYRLYLFLQYLLSLKLFAVWHQIAKPLCIWNVFVMNVFSFEYILLLSTPTTTTSTLKVLQAASSLCLLCLSLAEKAIRSSHASFL